MAERAGNAIAARYIDRIEALCNNLTTMPERGVRRSALGADIRTIALDRRILIAYRAMPDSVEILRILHAERDFNADSLPH